MDEFRLLLFALKPLPYLLCLLGGFFVIGGVVSLFNPRASEPTQLTIEQVERTPLDDLPDWVEVSGGILYWTEWRISNADEGGVRMPEKLLVPLVSQKTLISWNTFQEGAKTMIVVAFEWSRVKSEFPRFAAAYAADSEWDSIQGKQYPTVSFETLDVFMLSKIEKGAVETFQTANGFAESLVIEKDSEPITPGENVGMTAFGGAIMGGGIFWIRGRRKKNKANSQAAATQEPVEPTSSSDHELTKANTEESPPETPEPEQESSDSNRSTPPALPDTAHSSESPGDEEESSITEESANNEDSAESDRTEAKD